MALDSRKITFMGRHRTTKFYTENSTIAINQSRKHIYLMSDLFYVSRSNSQTRYPRLQCQIQYLLFFICLGFICLFRLVCLFCSVTCNSLSLNSATKHYAIKHNSAIRFPLKFSMYLYFKAHCFHSNRFAT